jgi:hypothetical protein
MALREQMLENNDVSGLRIMVEVEGRTGSSAPIMGISIGCASRE